MKTLQITEQNARMLYKTASAEFKTTLEDTFGKEFFSTKITDRVKSYQDACYELSEEPISESTLRDLGFTDDEIDYRKLKTITKALNEGWVANMYDTTERKWFPYFKVSSGFAFCVTGYCYSSAAAGGASRLCFKTEALAEYAGRQFAALYESFIK